MKIIKKPGKSKNVIVGVAISKKILSEIGKNIFIKIGKYIVIDLI